MFILMDNHILFIKIPFYVNIETDIQATIYEMKYKINLGQDEFFISQNPSWTQGKPPYITEIGLFDENKDLLVISKLPSGSTT